VPTKSRQKSTHLQQSWRKVTSLVAYLRISNPPTVSCDLAVLEDLCQEKLGYHLTNCKFLTLRRIVDLTEQAPFYRAITFSTRESLEKTLEVSWLQNLSSLN
jgi:hypothetical protein